MKSYQQFIRDKTKLQVIKGFKISRHEINPMLKPHQKDLVQWAIHGGCRAIFAAFGLGKTFIQLEILRIIAKHKTGRQLIIAPLGVRQEFRLDADKLGISITFIRKTEELSGTGIYITNYESVRDGKLDINKFTAVSLDEASCLRSYGSKTYQNFLTLFSNIPYRFTATATPSPNRYKELIHYAGFLGIKDTGESLTRWFKRDSKKANNLTLYPHKEKEFWFWVSTWANFIQKPSDLGHSDEGYNLPPLHVHYHEVESENQTFIDKRGQYEMFGDTSLSIGHAAKEKRGSISRRIHKMVSIINDDPDNHYILWHDQEAERKAIKKAVPSAVDVHGNGSMKLEERENRIIGFSQGQFKYLATKPILSGSGCNFQRHCHKSIFLGIGFKFNDFIQAIHRIYRFLQTHECHIHIIYTDKEREVLKTLKRKWKNHERMVRKMTDIIKKYGLSSTDMEQELTRSIGIERVEVISDKYTAVNNDTVLETENMPENSIDLIHTSIPFSNHYEYTPSYNDFGHTKDNAHFWEQMDYLTPNLLKILKPGRIYACHVKDRILFGNVTGKGAPTVSPFHAECMFHTMGHGFDYMGMITVVTDVVSENNQTYRLGYTEQCKDGSKMGVGSPEYIIIFRKPQTDRTKGYADTPVKKSKKEYSLAKWQVDAHAFWRSSGNRSISVKEMANLGPKKLAKFFHDSSIQNIYDHDFHIKLGERLDATGALPTKFMAIAPGSHNPNVWTDVVRMRTLNGEQSRHNLQQHICPLQFDIVDRIIERYSMPGETIFDPFAGLMTVPYRAVLKGRKGIGVELNPESYIDGINYLRAAESKVSMPSLFDCIDKERQAA